MNKKQVKAAALQLVSGRPATPYNGSPVAMSHMFRLVGEIGNVEEYCDLLDILDGAEQGDVVHLYINSIGGSVSTAISILHAMQRTQAAVVCHGDGEVTSAASLIFFAGDQLVIYPYTFGLLHDGSYATDFQQTHKHLEYAKAMNNLIKRMCRDIYQPYFNEAEVEEIMNGRDCHFFHEDLYERFKVVDENGIMDCGGGVISFVPPKNQVIEDVVKEKPKSKKKKKECDLLLG